MSPAHHWCDYRWAGGVLFLLCPPRGGRLGQRLGHPLRGPSQRLAPSLSWLTASQVPKLEIDGQGRCPKCRLGEVEGAMCFPFFSLNSVHVHMHVCAGVCEFCFKQPQVWRPSVLL